MHYIVKESEEEMMELYEELPSFDETLSNVQEETDSKKSSMFSSICLILLLKVNLKLLSLSLHTITHTLSDSAIDS